MKRIKIPAKTNLSKWAPFDQSSQGSEATGPTAQKTFDTNVVQLGDSSILLLRIEICHLLNGIKISRRL